MSIEQPPDTVDCAIVGGGPAGVAAAINLARACRSVVVIDCADEGRSDSAQRNFNYPGFPDGITAVELSALGRRQAERFGARFIPGEVHRVTGSAPRFRLDWGEGSLWARTILLATGVRDRWPEFPDFRQYVGRTMHWCLYCDGYEMQRQRVMVVGNDADAAELAIQFLRFTDDVTFVTNHGSLGLPETTVNRLASRGIPLVVGVLTAARAKERGVFDAIIVDEAREIPLDHLFSHQGADPNTELARALGVDLDEHGYVQVDLHARTSLPGVYAAGDVTRRFSHQVATAVHEGTTAATAVDHDLFEQEEQSVMDASLPPRSTPSK